MLAYAAAQLSSHGSGSAAVPIEAWDGAGVILRPIPGEAPLRDATGSYPMMPFKPGWDLRAGLEELRRCRALSATFVSDPLGSEPSEGFAHRRPFKRHHLVLAGAGTYAPCGHHRARIRRAARTLDVEEAPLCAVMEEWSGLYAGLVRRKGLRGALQDFGSTHFQALAAVGARAFAARDRQGAAAMCLWLTHGAKAYYHLAATDERGLRMGAAHLVMDAAIRTLLSEGRKALLLGAGLAPVGGAACGLDRFKAGFANAAHVNHLLGAVLDEREFGRLSPALAEYFPPYRRPGVQA